MLQNCDMTTPATWSAAQGLCRDMGGNLAALDNVKKNAFVSGYIVLHGKVLESHNHVLKINDQVVAMDGPLIK